MTKWEDGIKKYPEANFLQSPEYAKMNEILQRKTVRKNQTVTADKTRSLQQTKTRLSQQAKPDCYSR